jgi:hypothetical protein
MACHCCHHHLDESNQITKEIYDVLSQNSRFLKLNDQERLWEEITPLQARDKIGHALRFANHHTVTNAKGSTKKSSKKATGGLVRQSSFSSSSATSSSSTAADTKPSKAELVAELVEVAKEEPKVWDSLVDRLAHQEAALASRTTGTSHHINGFGTTPDHVASRHNRMASLADPVALENIAYAMESNTEDAALDDLIILLNDDECVTEEDLQDVLDMAAAEVDKTQEVPPTVSISVMGKRPPPGTLMMMRSRSSSVNLSSRSGTEDDMWSVMNEPLLEIDDDYTHI